MLCEIIYEDQEILIIHKPAGIATQSANIGQRDVVSELKGYLKKQKAHGSGKSGEKEGRDTYLGMIHRLDQPVEGLLVFAKTPSAAAALTKQLGSNVLNKKYLAVVLGTPKADQGRLVDYLRKEKNLAQIVDRQGATDAKEARLRYRLLGSVSLGGSAREESGKEELMQGGSAREESGKEELMLGGSARKEIGNGSEKKLSLLEVEIETGRFHQIRAQLAHAGIPILGDQKYGNADSMEISMRLGVRNVALCADRLEIVHPGSHRKMDWRIKPQGEVFRKYFHL